MEIVAFSIFFLYLIKKILERPEHITLQGQNHRQLSGNGSILRLFTAPCPLPLAPCLLFLLLIILVLFQMLPLPEVLLKAISPSGLATYRDFVNAPVGMYHPISLSPDATRQELFRVLSYSAVFFVIISHYRTKDQVYSLVRTILLMGGFLVIFAVVQKATWNGRIFWMYPIDETLSIGYIWGPYINRNHFAGYMEMAIPLGMGLLLYLAPRVSSLPDTPFGAKLARFMAGETIMPYSLVFVLVLMMAAALFGTFSRGGILAFVCSSLFFARITYQRRSLKRKTELLTLLACTIVIFVVIAAWDRIEDRFSDLEEDHVSRLGVWKDSLGIVHDYPLIGTGLGTFEKAFMRYHTGKPRSLFDHAHNDYIEIITDMGIAGFALCSWLAILFFHHIFRRWRSKQSMFGKCIGAGGLTSCVAIAVHSFTDFNLHIPANALLFAVISAITYAAIFNVLDRNTAQTPHPSGGRLGGGSEPVRRNAISP